MTPPADLLLDGTPWGFFRGLPVELDDPIVREVVSQVEFYLEKFDLCQQNKFTGEHIEVEGRLGVFIDPSSHERLKLPIETEALLCESQPNGEFAYNFASSISQYHFECFARTLTKELGLSADAEQLEVREEQHQPISRTLTMETMDVFVSYSANDDPNNADEDQKVRVSFDPEGRNILEAIQKDSLVKLNVYSGQDSHEDEVQLLVNESGEYSTEELRTAVDFRISVNKESTVDPSIVSQVLNRARDRPDTFRRRRSRKSYPILGVFRVDMTVVNTHQNKGYHSRSKVSHEIELEINPYVLYCHYLKKQRGDGDQRLDIIIANFVHILRAWVAFLNTNGTAELLTQKRASNQTSTCAGIFVADLTECAVSKERLDDYLQYVSPVVPLIGDYTYRCVVEHCKALPARMDQADVAESTRLHLTPDEFEAMQEREKQRILSVAI